MRALFAYPCVVAQRLLDVSQAAAGTATAITVGTHAIHPSLSHAQPRQFPFFGAAGSSGSVPRRFQSLSGPGLFGLQRLQRPEDFPAVAREAQERGRQLVGRILAAPADATVVNLMDELSNELCMAYDAAEACR